MIRPSRWPLLKTWCSSTGWASRGASKMTPSGTGGAGGLPRSPSRPPLAATRRRRLRRRRRRRRGLRRRPKSNNTKRWRHAVGQAHLHRSKRFRMIDSNNTAVRHGGVASSRFPVTRQIRPRFVQSTWESKVCARRDQTAQGHPGNRAGRETCPGHPVWARSSKARALEGSLSTSAMAGAILPAPPWPGKSGPDTSTLICWSAAPVEAEDHHCNNHCNNQCDNHNNSKH